MNQKQLIIVEGPDGAGKTTLIRKIKKQARHIKMRNHGAYIGEAFIAHHYFNTVWEAYSGRNSVILDRSWISEPIYGKAFRGGVDRVSVAHRRMLERMALSCRAITILCLPPFTVCAKVFSDRKEDEYLDTVSQLKKVYAGYKKIGDAQNKGAIPLIVYDWQMNIPDISDGKTFKHFDLFRPLVNTGPGAGNWDPGEVSLIVGEELYPGQRRNFPPFVNIKEKAGVAAWLADRCEEAGVPESKLYWVNAVIRNGQPQNPGFITALKPKKIFALGTVASEWCHESSHTFESLPHPKTWMDTAKEPYPLIKLLKEVK